MDRAESHLNRHDEAGHSETERIRADIDQTRSHLDQTLDKLGEKLRPAHWIGAMLGSMISSSARRSGSRGQDQSTAGHAAKVGADVLWSASQRAASRLGHTVKENPMPSLLIGAGLVWWLAREASQSQMGIAAAEYARERAREAEDAIHRRSGETAAHDPQRPGRASAEVPHRSDSIRDRVSEYASSAQETARSWVDDARQSTTHAAESVAERVSHGASRVSHSAQSAASTVYDYADRLTHQTARGYRATCQQARETFEQHPLLVGASVLAAGALLGAAIPSTRREDEAFGEQAEWVRREAREKASDLVDRSVDAARAGATAALGEADEQGLNPDDLKASAKDIARDSKEAAQASAEEHGLSPDQLKQSVRDVGGRAREAASQEFSRSSPEKHRES